MVKPKRSKAQKKGSQGHRWAMAEIEDSPYWIARGLDEDFGVDAEAELSESGVQGEILKLQFRTSKHIPRKKGLVRFKIDPKHIHYASMCRYPVIYVCIDLSEKQAWFLWLQEWLLSRRAAGEAIENPKSKVTVWVDERQTLATGLEGCLKEIAQWRGETQLVLSLLDALHAAAATYNENVLKQLIELIATSAPQVADTSMDVILREATLLGNRLRGTFEGNAIAEQLFGLVRRYGGRMSAFSVDAMVRRGDSLSRIGMIALGLLYDDHFDHALSLKLPSMFQDAGLPEVAYYCALREENSGKKSLNFIGGAGDFVFAGLKFHCPSEDRFMDKYANRGPSAIIDYLIPAGG